MSERKKRNNNNRARGKAFEKKMADKLGWIRVAYSGINDTFGWGDIRDHEDRKQSLYLGECKSQTPRNAKEINYSIKEEWLVGQNSIVNKAGKADSMPVLFFTKVRSPLTFTILRDEDFQLFTQAIDIMKHKGLLSNTSSMNELRKEIMMLVGEMVNESDS